MGYHILELLLKRMMFVGINENYDYLSILWWWTLWRRITKHQDETVEFYENHHVYFKLYILNFFMKNSWTLQNIIKLFIILCFAQVWLEELQVLLGVRFWISCFGGFQIDTIMSPHTRSLYACVGESTHAYQSPSKDLTAINNRLNNRSLFTGQFCQAKTDSSLLS